MNGKEDVRQGEVMPPTPSLDDFNEVAVSPASLSRIDRAEIDMQIATAHRFPRSIEKFRSKAMSMLTLNQETAEECFYVLKRKDNRQPGGEKRIEGPSVRLAEIVACTWGNMRAGGRVIDEDDNFIYGQGACHDLESNLAIQIEVSRRITGRDGRRYGPDMVAVTGNAAVSIAYRNAVLRVVPKALWLPLYLKAREIARGDEKTLESRREILIMAFGKLGVTEKMIYEHMGVGGRADLNLDHLVDLRGIYSAINTHEASVEEVFRGGNGGPEQGIRRASEAKPAESQPESGPSTAAAVPAQPPTATKGRGKGKQAQTAQEPGKPAANAKSAPSAEPAKPPMPAGPMLCSSEDVERAWKRLYAAGWDANSVKKFLEAKGLSGFKTVPKDQLEALLVEMESGGAPKW